jgi:hypothetical protein
VPFSQTTRTICQGVIVGEWGEGEMPFYYDAREAALASLREDFEAWQEDNAGTEDEFDGSFDDWLEDNEYGIEEVEVTEQGLVLVDLGITWTWEQIKGMH